MFQLLLSLALFNVEDKNTNIIRKYAPMIYEHLFSGMHQILHLKLDNII